METPTLIPKETVQQQRVLLNPEHPLFGILPYEELLARLRDPRPRPLHTDQLLLTESARRFIDLRQAVTVLFPHRSVLLFFHTHCLLSWRGRRLYTHTSYLFIRTNSSFSFFDLSTDLANS